MTLFDFRSKEQKIGDVMAKLAPFLLLYTEYVKNYDTSMSMLGKWTSQSPKFAAIIQEIQVSSLMLYDLTWLMNSYDLSYRSYMTWLDS